MIKYAGIGSRDTPSRIIHLMALIGEYMASYHDATLVSGHARGADKAFEHGCDRVYGRKEIWMPKLGFEGGTSTLLPSKEAFIVAKRFVEHWSSCGPFARACHARNCHQVLGANLKKPVNFIVAYTEGGELLGGTATALKIGMEFNVPILNLGIESNTDETVIEDFLEAGLRQSPRNL